MGISGQTIWRQIGNFLRKQKIIRKITYCGPGFTESYRSANGARFPARVFVHSITSSASSHTELYEIVRRSACELVVCKLELPK